MSYDASRRRFLKNSIVASAMLPLVNADVFSNTATAERLKVYIFSKHLQFLNYEELAEVAATMGFDGIDLTVRPKGHVLPERVADDLPRAVEAFRKNKLKPLIMTTAVDDANDNTDRQLLTTAASLGFKYYRLNWFPYTEDRSMPEAIDDYVKRMKELGEVNRQLDITGCYQNHAGKLVGASMWELWQILKEADRDHTGVQYDIRHAMVEGGTSWENGLRLVADKIKCLTIKDFKWARKGNQWAVEDVPIGQGMVDFKKYFGLIKKYKIDVPVSLHIEYSLGGAEHGATSININKREVFAAMKKDLLAIQRLWQES